MFCFSTTVNRLSSKLFVSLFSCLVSLPEYHQVLHWGTTSVASDHNTILIYLYCHCLCLTSWFSSYRLLAIFGIFGAVEFLDPLLTLYLRIWIILKRYYFYCSTSPLYGPHLDVTFKCCILLFILTRYELGVHCLFHGVRETMMTFNDIFSGIRPHYIYRIVSALAINHNPYTHLKETDPSNPPPDPTMDNPSLSYIIFPTVHTSPNTGIYCLSNIFVPVLMHIRKRLNSTSSAGNCLISFIVISWGVDVYATNLK